MPRRVQIKNACQQCRKKRTKCDGEPRCNKCEAAGIECVYVTGKPQSKGSLRSEIEHLRAIQVEDNLLLDALSSTASLKDRNAVLEALTAGEPRSSIALRLAGRESARGKPRPDGADEDTLLRARTAVDNNTRRRAMGPLNLDSDVLSELTAATPGSASTVTVPSPKSVSLTPMSSTGSHTEAEPSPPPKMTMLRRRNLLDAVLAWNCTPFCVLSNDLFIRDYERGYGENSSPALVSALLSLATRLDGGNNLDASHASLDYIAASEAFFAEANANLRVPGRTHNLADVQTLGVLALCHVSCGQTTEAEGLAERFADAITKLRLQEPHPEAMSKEFEKARANTYCGAISLCRLLHMTMRHVEDLPHSPLQVVAEHMDLGFGKGTDLSRVDLDIGLQIHNPQPNSPQFIAAKIFELTEWVYKLQAPIDEVSFEEIVQVYVQSLELYSCLFTTSKPSTANVIQTPFILFAHMHFHFCIITLFSPVLDSVQDDGACVRPRDVSKEAAQNIVDLAQSYSSLFAFGNFSGFLSCFIDTALPVLANAL